MVDRLIVLEKVSGRTEAEFLRSFLQARGIHCELSQETAGWVYGLGVGPIASVEILVPSEQGKKAREALKEYHKTRQGSHVPSTRKKFIKSQKNLKYLMRLIGAGFCILFSLLSIYMAVMNLGLAGGRGGLIVLSLLFLTFAAYLLRGTQSFGR